jgi:hypothetical protein
MVSRDLKNSEVKSLNHPVTHVFARDAVAISTNATSPLARAKQGSPLPSLPGYFQDRWASSRRSTYNYQDALPRPERFRRHADIAHVLFN